MNYTILQYYNIRKYYLLTQYVKWQKKTAKLKGNKFGKFSSLKALWQTSAKWSIIVVEREREYRGVH